ncbi:MAG: hypothetical protein IT223_12260 [Crocinitomicaceae bacterium]|nr:hypothetical protein [Crocinitomicaceae bacterium]
MKFPVHFLAAVVLFLFVSCESTPRIENMQEEVVMRNEDGSIRKASYFDKKTHEKLLEREYYSGNPDKKTFKEWSYKSGLKNGEARSYRENGAIWSLNTFTNDTLNGPYKTWQENGKPFIEGQYTMGEKSGKWTFYGKNGDVARTFDYDTMDSTMMRN